MRNAMLWVVGALLLAACSSSPSIPDFQAKQPLKVESGARARPVRFGNVIVEVPRGTIVGEKMGHLACYYTGKMKMAESMASFNDRELAFDFYDALRSAAIPTAGDPRQLHSRGSSAAELEVSGVVDKLWLNVCHPNEDYRKVKGGADIHVTWEVYDPILRKTIYSTTTEGAYKNYNTGDVDETGFILGALDAAITNLVADQGFHEVVLSDPMQNLAANEALKPIAVIQPDPPANGLVDARAATVTVISSSGSGSGVIISSEGYVLTAAHVVDEGRVVRVRLSTRRDVMGDVIRRDPVRDVALIKLAEDHLPALAIRSGSDPEVGEPVFAIGSPFGDQNDNTMTQGIVSTYRDMNGLKFLQSDASIQHGNSGGPLVDQSGYLVAISDSMLPTRDNVSEGINFFVPIGEAIECLNIRYRPRAASSAAGTPAAEVSGHME